jgi:uncharacterized protein
MNAPNRPTPAVAGRVLRRRLLAGAALALTACGTTTSPPTRWYELRSDPPVAPPSPAGDAAVWELAEVRLPGALERDTLVVGRGAAGVLPLAGHRWVEPLRDRVPRLLLQDLTRLRGPGRTWAAPAPPGVAVAWRLRVEVLVLQAATDRRALRLAAAWWLLDPRGDAGAPRPGSTDFEVPVDGASIDALAAAHRLALWRLAERIAAAGGLRDP